MRETAKLISVPETTYREWEYGRAARGEPYLKIAESFGVSLDDLLDPRNCTPKTLEQDIDRLIYSLSELKGKITKIKKCAGG